jgi:hypothetical protein
LLVHQDFACQNHATADFAAVHQAAIDEQKI